MTLRDRLRHSRLTPPAGPRYDLFELAFLAGSAALLVYTIPAFRTLTGVEVYQGPAPQVSAAEAWLTLPGQFAAGVCGIIGAAVVMGLSYSPRTMNAACWMLAVMGGTWAVILSIGLVVSPYPWRPVSTFFVIASLFLAQWTRKTWGRFVIERHWSEHCTTPAHREPGRP